MFTTWSFVLLSLRIIVCVGNEVSHDEYAMLPTIYKFNENEICPAGHVFCKINVKLKPKNETNPSQIWRIINKVNREETTLYSRDMIYRGFCVDEKHVNEEYDEYSKDGLTGWVQQSFCTGEDKFSQLLDSADMIIGLALTLYIIFVIYCTMKTYYEKKENDKSSQEVNKYVRTFSIMSTWKDLGKPSRSEDFDKLRSIQGMRTIAMIMIIAAHNFIGYIAVFSDNPEYVEEFCNDSYKAVLINYFGLLVQTYFTISAWLLAVQLHSIVKKNGTVTMRDVFTLALNRYFRLIPAVLLIILLHRSSSLVLIAGPIYHSMAELEINRCRHFWWRNLCFIQNFDMFKGQTCSPGTWYIAADTQMYLLVLILFYLSQKLKISMKFLLGGVVSIAVCIQGYTVLTTEFEGLLRFTPKLLPAETTFEKPEFIVSYTRTICQLASYVIGFAFGSIYTENKHKNIFDTTIKKAFWFVAFLGLPLLTSMMYNTNKNSRVAEAIMAVSMRPLFSLGIAIGFLGMATKTGGFIKKFLEWKPLVFLGNFTYCVYMFHFLIVIGRAFATTKMEHFDDLNYIKKLIVDVILSFAMGILMYTILEHPFVQLQKMILPQVKNKKEAIKTKGS